MHPITEKVLQRFKFENILMTTGIHAKRTRPTLDEILKAAEEEPRIYTALPAIIIYKPSVISKRGRDLLRHSDLVHVIETLFEEEHRPKIFRGIDTKDCFKAAMTYRQFLEQKKLRLKSRTMTLRLGNDDMERLKRLAVRLGKGNVSETIRYLARKEEKALKI